MNFYLINFLLSLFFISITLIKNLIYFPLKFSFFSVNWELSFINYFGFFDIVHIFYKAFQNILSNQAINVISINFFLFSFIKSGIIQDIIYYKKEWFRKRKYLTIFLITFISSFLSSSLSWFDEFIHFYPSIVYLCKEMNFDKLSPFFLLYLSSISGLTSLFSNWRIIQYFNNSSLTKIVNYYSRDNYNNDHNHHYFTFNYSEDNISFSSLSTSTSDNNYNFNYYFLFRLFSFFILTFLSLIFNIFYCIKKENKKESKEEEQKKENKKIFNKRRLLILLIFIKFLIISILSQISNFNFLDFSKKIPVFFSNDWGEFGFWNNVSIDCLFILGGLIISILDKKNIINNFSNSFKESFSILLNYLFSYVPFFIIENSINFESYFFLDNNGNYKISLFVFLFSIIISFIFNTTASTSYLISILSNKNKTATLIPTIIKYQNIEKDIEKEYIFLIKSAILSWMGGIIGTSFSPINVTLINSLQQVNSSYKEFIKKTWYYWIIFIIINFLLCFLII